MILITGATGSNGSEIIKMLAGSGCPVRAMVRRRPEPADARAGVEYVVADFDDPESVRRALGGVERAFLTTNSSERVEAQQRSFVDQARMAGVRHIVYLSQLHADRSSPVRFLRYHAVVEHAIASSGLAFTNLRPNLYMQSLFGFRSSIARESRFFAPAGDAAVSIVDVRDIASVAVAALTQNGHEYKTYDITGPQSLTHRDLASTLTTVLGKGISFSDIPEAAMLSAVLGLGVPEWQAEGLIEDYAHYRRGEATGVSSAVHEVTGRPPHSFRDFVEEYHEVFLRQN